MKIIVNEIKYLADNKTMCCKFLQNSRNFSIKKIAAIAIYAGVLQLTPVIALGIGDLQGSMSNPFQSLFADTTGQTSYRSLLIPQGGRAESLGTSYTGLSNDIGFLDYNPAGSATLKQTEFSLFHNNWIADSSIDSFAWTTRLNNFGMGAGLKCFYVPFTEYDIFGEKVSSTYYSESTLTLNASYNFLSSYSFKGLSFGGNIKTSFRSMPDYSGQSGIALMADLGLLTRFNFLKFYSSREPNMRVGIAVVNIGAGITGFGTGICLDDPLPSRIAAGLSYKVIRPLTFTFEYRKPINLLDIKASEESCYACGVMIDAADFISLMGGFLLQGGNPRFSTGAEFMVKNIRMGATYTLDLSSSANPVNHISVSAKLLLGDRGRQDKQDTIDKLYRDGLLFYAQSAVAEDTDQAVVLLDKAMKQWQRLLRIDPEFDPAIKGINVIKEERANLKKVKEAQMLQ